MISEVMSFVCSDSCENGVTKQKCVRKDQANNLFQSISRSKAMDWNFQIVKYLDELVQHYGGRKSDKQKFQTLSWGTVAQVPVSSGQ